MVVALIVLGLLFISSTGAEEISDAQFKAFKIKQLKKFLLDRGVECKDCVEKADFVKLAIQHKKTAIRNPAGRAPTNVPTTPLWEQWSATAKDICERTVTPDQKEQKFCKPLVNVVENVLMKYTKRYQKELKVEKQQLVRYTLTEPYKEAGEKRILKAVMWMSKTNTKTQSEVEKQIEEPLQSWLRDCSLQNINTMHDTLRDEL